MNEYTFRTYAQFFLFLPVGVRRCPGFGPGAAGGLGSTQSAWTHLPVDVLWSPETVCLVV